MHAGKTFVGSIGVEGGNYQFAALGDPMNFCARLVAAANGGEMLVSETVWEDVSGEITAEPRSLELKGYAEPVKAYVTTVTPSWAERRMNATSRAKGDQDGQNVCGLPRLSKRDELHGCDFCRY